MDTVTFANEIVRCARVFVGLKEIKANAEWDNPNTFGIERELSALLKKYMRPAPWNEGESYCAAFCEAVWRMAGEACGLTLVKFQNLMNAGVVRSYDNFRAAGLVRSTPVPGAIWLAERNGSGKGHAEIVVKPEAKMLPVSVRMFTIGANTSLDPSTPAKEREGEWITTRSRHVRQNGDLKTLGFVWPGDFIP